MPGMTITTKESGKSQGVKYAALAVVAGGLFVTYNLGSRWFENNRYNTRVGAIEKLINQGNTKEAITLLEKYKESKVIELGDMLRLRSQAQAKEKEKTSAAVVSTLEKLVSQGRYREAWIGYMQHAKKVTIPASLEKKLEGLSLPSLVAKAGTATGMDYINLVDGISKSYPSYQGLPALKEKQLQTYLLLIGASFSSVGSPEKISFSIKKFHSWMQQQKPELVAQGNYSSFFRQGNSYLKVLRGRDPTPKKYEVGDVVTFTQALGKLKGWDKNRYFFMYHWKFPTDTKRVPIGSKGVIIKNEGEKYFIHSRKADGTRYFLRKEFEPVKVQQGSLVQVTYHLNAIKQYVQQVKGEKK